MKKIFIVLLAAGVFISCNNNGKTPGDDRRTDRETDDYRNRDNNDEINSKEDNRTTEKWSSADVSKFNRDCAKLLEEKDMETAVKDKVCDCLLEKFEGKYTSYDELDRKGTAEEGEAMAGKCMTELGISGNDDNKGSGGWTRYDQQQWMDICESSVGDKMGKESRYDYCWCVLEKLETRYENYDKMNRQGTEQEGISLGKECIRKLGIQQ